MKVSCSIIECAEAPQYCWVYTGWYNWLGDIILRVLILLRNQNWNKTEIRYECCSHSRQQRILNFYQLSQFFNFLTLLFWPKASSWPKLFKLMLGVVLNLFNQSHFFIYYFFIFFNMKIVFPKLVFSKNCHFEISLPSRLPVCSLAAKRLMDCRFLCSIYFAGGCRSAWLSFCPIFMQVRIHGEGTRGEGNCPSQREKC